MRRLFFITIMMTICGMTAMAQDRPDLTNQSGGGNHGGIVCLTQQPTLVYEEENEQIVVYGCETDFYDVKITMQSIQGIVWQGTIDGEYGIISTAALINGTYNIILTNDNGTSFTWSFNRASGAPLNRLYDRMSAVSIKGRYNGMRE